MEEVFARLKARMLEGMVFHDEMARYYDFLNECGYRDEHLHHYEEETKGYHRLCEYYMHHFNKLLPNYPMERPSIIPDSWAKYSREDVDSRTRENAVKSGFQKWVEWETETKDLYEEMCGELLNNGEIAAEQFVAEYVRDVDRELSNAMDLHIRIKSL